ncbi:uncharacterized protein [Oscarella lobularis]|uniref:uncharacterized protein n=1 Tax=Oscarella lobularis TaxID=121494 RepID=UPI00331352EA
MSFPSFLDEFTDVSRTQEPWDFDGGSGGVGTPWLSPVYSPVPSVCAYEEESNGPFIGRSDPLLSSSASNLLVAVETEKEKARPLGAATPTEKPIFSSTPTPTPTPMPTPALAQLKREDHFSLRSLQHAENARLPLAPATENSAPKQEANSRFGVGGATSSFSFQLAPTTTQSPYHHVPSSRLRETNFGSMPKDLQGGVVTSDPPTPPTALCSGGGGGKKRSSRVRSLRATSMSSICSATTTATTATAAAADESETDGVEDDDDDVDFDEEDVGERALVSSSSLSSRLVAGASRKRGRRKDGFADDFLPCPARLNAINRQLGKLNDMMAAMTPVTEVPAHAKNKCRKERNKLASRACRLKKKASFEANKVKLHGLEEEQDRLRQAIASLKGEIERRKENPHLLSTTGMVGLWNEIAKPALSSRVAGRTSEYVSDVLGSMENSEKDLDSDGSESD